MGNFSKNPDAELIANVNKKYVGVRIEQNVPLLDRDLNLAVDLLGADLRGLIQRYIGDGVAPGNDTAFAITPANPTGNDFMIGAGKMLVGGIEVEALPLTLYSSDPSAPPLTDAPATGRIDTVYIDVWLSEFAWSVGLPDQGTTDLGNTQDINMPTAVRLKPAWKVRVAQNSASIPADDMVPGHAYTILAQLNRKSPKIISSEISSWRSTRLQLADLVRRVTTIEADVALLMTALEPKFWVARPFDKPSGYNGREVVLYGRNFDLGTVQVSVTDGQNSTPVEIIGDLQPNAITVFLRTAVAGNYLIPPVGDVTFTVTTDFGSTTSPGFRNWGPPTFNPGNWPYTPNTIPNGDPFVINGKFLNAPGLEVQIQLASQPASAWVNLGVSQPTPTTINVTFLPFQDTWYNIRMRSEVSQAWTYGPDVKSSFVIQFP